MNRQRLGSGLVIAAVLLAASTASAINCDQARKAAATGRTVDEIAETMIADPAEVKKCLDESKKSADDKKPAGSPQAGGSQ